MKAAPRQHGAAPHATQAPSAQTQARAAAEALDEFDAFGDEERYATIGDPHRTTPAIVTRRLLILFALVAGLVAACGLTWAITWQHGIDTLRRNAAVRADRTTAALKSTLDRYESLPYLLGEHPIVQDALASPDADNVARANQYLEDLNRRARANVAYIVTTSGRCVAASNWNQPDSFIGQEYLFRPYFVEAVKGRVGRFFGIGTTSLDPGYYISQPVRRDGKIVGVAVVKLNLEWFQGADASEPLIVTDDHGVIFLSSVPAWKYHTVKPLTSDVIASIFDTRQYARQPIAPLPMSVVRTLEGGAQIVRIGGGRSGNYAAPRFLASQRTLGEPDWRLITMAPIDPVNADARYATIVTGFGYVSLCLLLFYWRMRRARVREVMRSRALLQKAYAELNQRVAERTADLSQANEQLTKEVSERTRAEQELRAAHDELIQASKLAALGQMAAGITHELNQPLAALRGFSDNTRVFLERGDHESAKENLEAIAALTERMGKITNQLKLFVGRARPRNARAGVARALRNVLALLQKRLQGVTVEVSLIDEGAAPVRFNLDSDDPKLVAHCEDLRLEQVLINLLGNALDAVAGMPAPRIAIDVQTSQESLAIIVSDNGPGIPDDVLPRLFEPFFTTKEMGQGLGLGLAICSSIARDCGGSLVARNNAQGGAEFMLTLRRAQAQATDIAGSVATGS
ncbi:integral membrane sensor signal transduction histidine kinase [Paraburkholderia hospita]|uniref:histidine kinase n=1 Tax=Paraburkholderia hospita TaxID=169430 RepID=A0ABP2PXI8_9BURK|nr:sensor histidine kinase [Paraburkholderia hospita]EUC21352.1 integral membrane sensor signal transduction histidine kinase [Burkholderia sp. BT03]SKC68021.1 histidine kinase [Burkholderia sp. CF099]EIN02472.1 integral membrane sensor signal transduction histidine kinase [Paraburkholderia hospita]OUL68438.1 two-component sensor histidine kinase [Paraburkholderia hospita]OUL81639.1 two-component sensor histidine kinase [Paraburkholderia hospita]